MSQAQVGPYSQNFEALVQTDPNALANDGWLVFGNVFDGMTGAYLYGYGPNPAPNGGPAFCGITTGEGGPPQGDQQLVAYSDYNNGDHGNGNIIEANVFQEQIVGAGDIGKTYKFQFDAKLGDIMPNSTALAFIKVIDNVTFGLSAFEMVDTTTTPTTWSTYSLSTTIDATQVGHFFQIGFLSTATNFTPSGMIYDNIFFGEDVAPGTALCFGDGAGANCGCGNNGASDSGCANSTGMGAILSASGIPSLSSDSLVLSVTQTTNQPGVFFQGDVALAMPSAFGDGIRCCGQNVVRIATYLASGNAVDTDTGNQIGGVGPPISAIPLNSGLMAGDSRCYQYWYRDPGMSNPCGVDFFNLSNGYVLSWLP